MRLACLRLAAALLLSAGAAAALSCPNTSGRWVRAAGVQLRVAAPQVQKDHICGRSTILYLWGRAPCVCHHCAAPTRHAPPPRRTLGMFTLPLAPAPAPARSTGYARLPGLAFDGRVVNYNCSLADYLDCYREATCWSLRHPCTSDETGTAQRPCGGGANTSAVAFVTFYPSHETCVGQSLCRMVSELQAVKVEPAAEAGAHGSAISSDVSFNSESPARRRHCFVVIIWPGLCLVPRA